MVCGLSCGDGALLLLSLVMLRLQLSKPPYFFTTDRLSFIFFLLSLSLSIMRW
jgi:hypothetical protein